MHERVNADAWKIRKDIREAEAVVGEALAALAKLKLSMLQARTNPAVLVGTGQDVLVRLGRAEERITGAMSDIFRIHYGLSDIARTTAGVDEDIQTDRIRGTVLTGELQDA